MLQGFRVSGDTDRRGRTGLCSHYNGFIGEITLHFFSKGFKPSPEVFIYKGGQHFSQGDTAKTWKIGTCRQVGRYPACNKVSQTLGWRHELSSSPFEGLLFDALLKGEACQ